MARLRVREFTPTLSHMLSLCAQAQLHCCLLQTFGWERKIRVFYFYENTDNTCLHLCTVIHEGVSQVDVVGDKLHVIWCQPVSSPHFSMGKFNPNKTSSTATTKRTKSPRFCWPKLVNLSVFPHSYRASWYYKSFNYYSPTDTLVSCLKKTLKFTLKQLRHVSVLQLHRHQWAR